MSFAGFWKSFGRDAKKVATVTIDLAVIAEPGVDILAPEVGLIYNIAVNAAGAVSHITITKVQ